MHQKSNQYSSNEHRRKCVFHFQTSLKLENFPNLIFFYSWLTEWEGNKISFEWNFILNISSKVG